MRLGWGNPLGARLDTRVTNCIADAIEEESAESGVTEASVVRRALTLGLRAMGRPVEYAEADAGTGS